jgi:hypothetical protein
MLQDPVYPPLSDYLVLWPLFFLINTYWIILIPLFKNLFLIIVVLVFFSMSHNVFLDVLVDDLQSYNLKQEICCMNHLYLLWFARLWFIEHQERCCTNHLYLLCGYFICLGSPEIRWHLAVICIIYFGCCKRVNSNVAVWILQVVMDRLIGNFDSS